MLMIASFIGKSKCFSYPPQDIGVYFQVPENYQEIQEFNHKYLTNDTNFLSEILFFIRDVGVVREVHGKFFFKKMTVLRII
jgi:hypothetical protein